MDTALARRQRRSTWILGGILLIVPALIDIILRTSLGAAVGWGSRLIFLLAVIIFTVGIGPAGSVTARRPLGTVSALVFGALLAAGGLLPLLPALARPASGDVQAMVAAATTVALSSLAIVLVALVFGVIAAVQIARAGVVPAPWRWAPLWALGAGVIGSLVGMLLPVFLITSGLPVAETANLVMAGISGAAEIFLGIVAIALGIRERPEGAAVGNA